MRGDITESTKASRVSESPRLPHRLDPERVARHLQALFRSARGWTSSREEAEDLVQETFARVFARPRLVRGDDLGYLMRAMHNVLVSQRRAAGRHPVSVELDEELESTTSGRDDPAGGIESREVLSAIEELPSEFRDALVAVDVAGLSYREASNALGVAEGTVTSRLFRARDRIARRLGER